MSRSDPKHYCDFPGCGAELKPLFQTYFCPKEEEHIKMQEAAARKSNCQHPIVMYLNNGTSKCLACGEELTAPLGWGQLVAVP